MYAITGATGNVGNVIANKLLANGKNVIAIGRNSNKLDNLIVKGAIPIVGDLNDPSFINRAFDSVNAVFCMIPSNLLSQNPRKDQQIVARNYVNAVRENGIKHVVLLSSSGAHLRNGAGLIDGLADMELYFSELKDVNVLILRPAYFMENTISQIGIIKKLGMLGTPLQGDLKIPMVATKDIGEIAANRLKELDFTGHSIQYILGQRDISYNEITQIIGKSIGNLHLNYVQFSYEEAKKNMVQSGMISENAAELFNEMTEGINNGKINGDIKRNLDNTTPTSFEEFSQVFANAFVRENIEHH